MTYSLAECEGNRLSFISLISFTSPLTLPLFLTAVSNYTFSLSLKKLPESKEEKMLNTYWNICSILNGFCIFHFQHSFLIQTSEQLIQKKLRFHLLKHYLKNVYKFC